MSNTEQTPKPATRRDPELTHREAAKIAAADQLHRLQSCINWQLGNGISVISFDGFEKNGMDYLRVIVKPRPQLYMLYKNDCTWYKRFSDNAGTRFSWVAERFGVRIEWEETKC